MEYFASNIIGKGDSYSLIWRLWHTQSALYEGRWYDLFFSNMLFYPLGTSLWIDTPIINSLISYPAYLLGGPIFAYNSLIFISFVGTFIGMYLFLSVLTKDKKASFLGALGFTFSMWRLAHLRVGHIDLLSTQWIGFMLWFLFLFYQRQKNRYLIGALCLLIVQIYTDYKLGIMAIMLLVGIVILWILFDLLCRNMKRVQFFMISLIQVIVAVCIGLIPLYMISRAQSIPLYAVENTFIQVLHDSTQIASLVIPGYGSKSSYLGILSIFLVGIYVVYANKKVSEIKQLIIWGIVFVWFLLLSFGPRIQPVYAVTRQIPFAWVFHVPDHFIFVVQIALSVFVSFSCSWVCSQIGSKQTMRVYFVVLAFGIIVQNPGFLNFPLLKVDMNNPIVENIKIGQKGSVLSIPFGYFDSYRLLSSYEDQRIFLDQTLFYKPVVAGYVTRADTGLYRNFNTESIFNKLIKCQNDRNCTSFSQKEIQRLKEYYRVKYIVMYDTESYTHIRTLFDCSFPQAKKAVYQDMTLWSM